MTAPDPTAQEIARLSKLVISYGVQIGALQAKSAALQAERDALAKAAERYRWLREANLDKDHYQISMVTIYTIEHAFDELDAAIDAAIEKGKANG